MLIDKTEAEVKKILDIHPAKRGGTLRLVGEPGAYTVSLQQPAVADPDVDTDTDWMAIKDNSTAFVLDEDNNAKGVPFTGIMRVVKPASAGSEFGVDYV